MFIGKISSSVQESVSKRDFNLYVSLDANFGDFVDEMYDALSKVEFCKVKRKCLENLDVCIGILLSKHVQDQIQKSTNLCRLFSIVSRLKQYWNWMNIRMLEKMAGNCSAAKKLIEKYKIGVLSRKVEDVIFEINQDLKIPEDKYIEVKEKWKKDFKELLVGDIIKRWEELEKKLNVRGAMLLKNITKGCVEVCWVLPNYYFEIAVNSVVQGLFPEVLYLKIGHCVIKDDRDYSKSKLIVVII